MFTLTYYRASHSLLFSTLLILSSYLNAAETNRHSAKPTYAYNHDLSPWGPHPESSLKVGALEPRYIKLSYAEQEKVRACVEGYQLAGDIMLLAAIKEYGIDSITIAGGPPRSQPVGKQAKELFREEVTQHLKNDWPISDTYGQNIAHMYGLHFGYPVWEEEYWDMLTTGHVVYIQTHEMRRKRIREEFWPKCLRHVPTACFERGPPHPKHCLADLIHPRRFPAFREVADLYIKAMEKPNGW